MGKTFIRIQLTEDVDADNETGEEPVFTYKEDMGEIASIKRRALYEDLYQTIQRHKKFNRENP